jgi:hypothetical protein
MNFSQDALDRVSAPIGKTLATQDHARILAFNLVREANL